MLTQNVKMEKQGQHNHILASQDSLRKLDISP